MEQEPTYIIVHAPSQRLTDALYAQDWKKAVKVLQSREYKKRTVFSLSLAASSASSASSIRALGIAFSVSAQRQISEAVINQRGQQTLLPIHIACMNGAPSTAIQAIIGKHTKACLMAIDPRDRTPLHYSIEFLCNPKNTMRLHSKRMIKQLKKGEKNKNISLMTISEKDFMDRMQTIKMLARASPESVYHADEDGNTPIDIVHNFMLGIENEGLDRKRAEMCCLELRKVAIRNYRKKKQTYEMKGEIRISSTLMCICPFPTTQRSFQPISALTMSSATCLTSSSSTNASCPSIDCY
jgi:hypothetical protein